MLICIETHRTCDFPGGVVWTPIPPMDAHIVVHELKVDVNRNL